MTPTEIAAAIKLLLGGGMVSRPDYVHDYAPNANVGDLSVPLSYENPMTCTGYEELVSSDVDLALVEWEAYADGSPVIGLAINGLWVCSTQDHPATYEAVTTAAGVTTVTIGVASYYGGGTVVFEVAGATGGDLRVHPVYGDAIIGSIIAETRYMSDVCLFSRKYGGSTALEGVPRFSDDPTPTSILVDWEQGQTHSIITCWMGDGSIRGFKFTTDHVGDYSIPCEADGLDYDPLVGEKPGQEVDLPDEDETPAPPTPAAPVNVGDMHVDIFTWESYDGLRLAGQGVLGTGFLDGICPVAGTTTPGSWYSVDVSPNIMAAEGLVCIKGSRGIFLTEYRSHEFEWVAGGCAQVKLGRAKVYFAEAPFALYDCETGEVLAAPAAGTSILVEPDARIKLRWTDGGELLTYNALGAAGFVSLDSTVLETAWLPPVESDPDPSSEPELPTLPDIYVWLKENKVLVAVVIAAVVIVGLWKKFTS